MRRGVHSGVKKRERAIKREEQPQQHKGVYTRKHLTFVFILIYSIIYRICVVCLFVVSSFFSFFVEKEKVIIQYNTSVLVCDNTTSNNGNNDNNYNDSNDSDNDKYY